MVKPYPTIINSECLKKANWAKLAGLPEEKIMTFRTI